MELSLDIFLILVLMAILLASAIIDIRVQKIPNLITFPTMVFALFYHFITNGWSGLIFSAEGLGLGLFIFLIPHLMGGMGAGDVKLMGAIGAVVGPEGAFLSFIYIAIAGGIYALILLLFNIQFTKGFIKRSYLTLKTLLATGNLIPIPEKENEKKPRLCYGVAIALGTFFYLYAGLKGFEFVFI